MLISGEDIRQEAERREQTCPKEMKDSFYYGFREGAKWALKMIEQNKEEFNTERRCHKCFWAYNCYEPSEDSDFDAETCNNYQE